MSAPTSNPAAATQKQSCPHCGKPYRTLVKRNYSIRIDGGMKQSVPMGSQWRCMGCGKSYTTDHE